MNGNTFFMLLFCFITCSISAQSSDYKRVSVTDNRAVIEAVAAQSKKTQTLQASFTQTKKVSMLTNEMTSNGKMYFMAPNMLRWSYLEPQKSSFILNNNVIKAIDAQGKITTPNSSFSELSRLIVSMMKGDGLTDGQNFTIICYANSSNYLLKLVPVNKKLKQMFAYLTLTADKKTKTVSMVQIVDANGNQTKIRFFNMKINQPIDNKVFQL